MPSILFICATHDLSYMKEYQICLFLYDQPLLLMQQFQSITQSIKSHQLMGHWYSLFMKDKSQISELKKENDIFKRELARAFQEMGQIRQGLNYIKKNQTSAKGEDSLQSSPPPFQFDFDMTAPNIDTVRVKGKQIKMAGTKSQGYRISSLLPLPETGVHTVTLRIIKFMQNKIYGIFLGLSTDKCKNEVWNKDKLGEIAYYGSWVGGSGKCKIGGEQMQLRKISYNHRGALQGQQVQMLVDMNARQISFTKKGSSQRPQVKISEMPLPVPFLNTPLYAYVQLGNFGDIVEIM